jgi:membrane peptidoglycan carboxypeptidase
VTLKTHLTSCLATTVLQVCCGIIEERVRNSQAKRDYEEIGRALSTDLRSQRYSRGGSTITQQVAKNLFLSQEKTLRRKVREAVLARRLERVLAKNEILEIYLNIADWGDGLTGAEAASRFYFHKGVSEVSWREAAILTAMLANPHVYSPLKSPIEVQLRRDAVLAGLLDSHELSPQEYQQAVSLACCVPSVQEKELRAPWRRTKGKAKSTVLGFELAGLRAPSRALSKWWVRTPTRSRK